jgi:hypothetical protein
VFVQSFIGFLSQGRLIFTERVIILRINKGKLIRGDWIDEEAGAFGAFKILKYFGSS